MHTINYSHGVDVFYIEKGDSYRNPHEERVLKVIKSMHKKFNLQKYTGTRILDLACGSGEASIALSQVCTNLQFTFIDPYTKNALSQRISNSTCHNISFMDIVNGSLNEIQPDSFHLIVISYAFHLIPQNIEKLFTMEISLHCNYLLLIHPHKRNKDICGFQLLHEDKFDQTVAYLYQSNNFINADNSN
eukprot:NODE_345_length_9042_cov_0.258973.p4 type:complete len:189 gc:universal NODE_345_length_9042_cov_0.258973:1331-765(-)